VRDRVGELGPRAAAAARELAALLLS
jgi:hypothetical protein